MAFRRFASAIGVCAGLWAALAWAPAVAQSPFGFSEAPNDAPALIDAREIVYDDARQVVTAIGDVVVVQGARALSAGRIDYFIAEDRVSATGGVTLLEPGGEVLKADSVELSQGLKRAVADTLGLRLTDGSRLVGRKAERVAGVGATLTDAAFTPCALCEDDPDRPPVWRLRARKVVHDEVAHDINYEDVTLDIAGVPIAYLPYFSHPDPTVERRTGFLAPTLSLGGELNAILEVPYFISLAPNVDLTFKPLITANSPPVAAAEYRHLFANGRVDVDGSIGILNRLDNDDQQEDDVLRGHAFVEGAFALDDTWRLTFDGRVSSDDSYLETFGIEDADVLRSEVAVEGFWREAYVRVGAFGAQDLRELADQDDTPFALPELRGAALGEPGPYGNAFAEADARVLGRDAGAKTQSASAAFGWQAQTFGLGGQRFDVEARLRGDVYNTEDGGDVEDGVAARGVPTLLAGWRFPVARQDDWGALIIEPRAQLVLGLDRGRAGDVPNEDSRAVEFDESNFFSLDRFPGRDQVDDGQRVDYGVTATALFARGGRASGFVGQSTSRKTGDFYDAAGMDGRSSDIVTALDAAPSPWLDLSWRTRLARANLSVKRQEIAIGGGPDWLRARAAYVRIDSELQGPEQSIAAEQLNLGLAVKVDENWSFAAAHDSDLDVGRSLRWSASIVYQDECISVDLGYERDFQSQADGGGREDTLVLRVSFKHLGGIGIRQGFSGDDDDDDDSN